MTPEQADKIAYWMTQQHTASTMIVQARALGDYYDTAYYRAWSARHALAFRQIERHRHDER